MDKKLFYKTLPVLIALSVIVLPNILTAETRTGFTEDDIQIKIFISKNELENFILMKVREAESNNRY